MTVVVNRNDPRFDTLKRGHNARFPSSEADAADRILLCLHRKKLRRHFARWLLRDFGPRCDPAATATRISSATIRTAPSLTLALQHSRSRR